MNNPRKLEDREIVFNAKTGERLTTKKDITVNTTDSEFFMVFLENLASLYQLKNATEIHVLAKLCSLTTMNTNTVLLPPALRKQVCEEIKISQQAMTNALRELRGKGLLDGENGVFTINPELMWKGSTEARRKWLQSEQGLEFTVRFKQTRIDDK